MNKKSRVWIKSIVVKHYNELTKKKIKLNKKIKSNQKLPHDYIELIKKDQTEWKRLNQIKNCSDWILLQMGSHKGVKQIWNNSWVISLKTYT